MRSIYLALIIVTVFEVCYIDSIVIPQSQRNDGVANENQQQNESAQNPANDLIAASTIVNEYFPNIIEALSELPSSKIEEMWPHMYAVTTALQGSLPGLLFGNLYNLLGRATEMKRMTEAYNHINQILNHKGPIIVKQTTKVTLANLPTNDDSMLQDDISHQDRRMNAQRELTAELAAAHSRMEEETRVNLQQLRLNAQQMQQQIAQEIKEANASLLNQIQQVNLQAKQELRQNFGVLKNEAQKGYKMLHNFILRIRQEMQNQMRNIDAEISANSHTNEQRMNQLQTNIRENLAVLNQDAHGQAQSAAYELKERFNNMAQAFTTQLMQSRNDMNEDLQQVWDTVNMQVQDLRDRMRGVVGDLKKEMENDKIELTQNIEDASNQAKEKNASNAAMKTQLREEMNNAIAEMKRSTDEMRENLKAEVRAALQTLSREIESVLHDTKITRDEDVEPSSDVKKVATSMEKAAEKIKIPTVATASKSDIANQEATAKHRNESQNSVTQMEEARNSTNSMKKIPQVVQDETLGQIKQMDAHLAKKSDDVAGEKLTPTSQSSTLDEAGSFLANDEISPLSPAAEDETLNDEDFDDLSLYS